MVQILRILVRSSVLVLTISSCLMSCGTLHNYDITLNNVPIYQTVPRASADGISDQQLANCIRETIIESEIHQSSSLVHLECTNAGISSLNGLARFSALINLNLSNNRIKSLKPLSKLASLEYLRIDNNKIDDPTPALKIRSLLEVDFRGNTTLRCPLESNIRLNLNLELPRHCKSG